LHCHAEFTLRLSFCYDRSRAELRKRRTNTRAIELNSYTITVMFSVIPQTDARDCLSTIESFILSAATSI
jgi:hypothetical protein